MGYIRIMEKKMEATGIIGFIELLRLHSLGSQDLKSESLFLADRVRGLAHEPKP